MKQLQDDVKEQKNHLSKLQKDNMDLEVSLKFHINLVKSILVQSIIELTKTVLLGVR